VLSAAGGRSRGLCAASALTGLWRPPDTRRKDRTPRRTHRRAHRATQLPARAARVDARGLNSGASPPPSTQARRRSSAGRRWAASRFCSGGRELSPLARRQVWHTQRKTCTGRIPPPHQRPRRCVPRHSGGCESGRRGGTWALVRRIPPPPPPGGTRAVDAWPLVGGLVVAAAASARSGRWRQTRGRHCSLDWLDWLDGDSRRDC